MNEKQRDELLNKENDLLAGILGAVKDKESKRATIEINRGGKTFLSFDVRPISSDVFRTAQERASRYKPGKEKEVESVDTDRMYAELIVMATVPEDKELLWGNKEVQKQLSVPAPHFVVQKVLLSGEMRTAVSIIEDLSGYSLDPEDLLKKEVEKYEELKN